MSNDAPNPDQPAEDSRAPGATPPCPTGQHPADSHAGSHEEAGSGNHQGSAPKGSADLSSGLGSEPSTPSPPQVVPSPQRTPPLPRSRFTRHLIDYLGGGEYQLSVQGSGEGIIPLAKAHSPLPLLLIASHTSEPGDELFIAPAVALIDAACMETVAIQALRSKGRDPFERIGSMLIKRPVGEAPDASPTGSDWMREHYEPIQGADEARSGGPDPEPLSGLGLAEIPELLHELLDQDRKTGGRLGWIFRIDRASGEEDGKPDGNGS